MTDEYMNILQQLLAHSENEVVEFKRAENNFDYNDLGKYFSALSNEANLREHPFAWLVFGIDNKTHDVVGTTYKNSELSLNKLKHDFAQHTSDGLTFRDIVPVTVEGRRVLMFKIPATPRNIVMRWQGIAYGRDGESLVPLNQAKMDEIREQSPMPDYDIDNERRSVGVTIYGKIIDEKFTLLLKRGNELSLKECLWLDAIQKNRPITQVAIDQLKQKKLIEGRRDHYYISLSVAKITNQVGQYTRNKGLAYNALIKLILQLANNAGEVGFKKNQVYDALEASLPTSKDTKGKMIYLGHVLSKMNADNLITAQGRKWFITPKGENELNK